VILLCWSYVKTGYVTKIYKSVIVCLIISFFGCNKLQCSVVPKMKLIFLYLLQGVLPGEESVRGKGEEGLRKQSLPGQQSPIPSTSCEDDKKCCICRTVSPVYMLLGLSSAYHDTHCISSSTVGSRNCRFLACSLSSTLQVKCSKIYQVKVVKATAQPKIGSPKQTVQQEWDHRVTRVLARSAF
jgi:hypothetical protein